MRYYFSKTVDYSFDEAVAKVTAELKEEGFGILTEAEGDRFRDQQQVENGHRQGVRSIHFSTRGRHAWKYGIRLFFLSRPEERVS